MSQPPYSVEITYLPSEKAPAPAMPSMMAQEAHLMHLSAWPVMMGQRRSVMGRPFSRTSTERPGAFSVSRQAVMMPPMPPPMMITS